jgi:hypothetical protein
MSQSNTELRFRQVHLDFHTSQHIGGIGSEFDADKFVHTLKEAAVDSITCFSRCHHGYIYHDTKFPYQHPDLKCNLLVEQVRACHAADIKVPVYITVGWDHLQSTLHPEWNQVDANGKMAGRTPLTDGWGWYFLDFASPYVDYLEAQTIEVCELLGDELDGVFFDIIHQSEVFSTSCMDRFKKLGWNPEDKSKQAELKLLLLKELTDRMSAVVRRYKKDATIFFNGGHIGPDFRERLNGYTHMEVESLPSGGWGYMHFPITSRYSRSLGLDFLGMTGKFSEMWGHFNSYKNPVALEYECFSALAQGGKCSVGDQLPPNGILDKATYELIGSVYRQVRDVEPWCTGARAKTEIAVVNAEGFAGSEHRRDPRNHGAARMLMEGRHQFDFVDMVADLSKYSVLVLTDGLKIADPAPIEKFIAGGGSVIVAGSTVLDANGIVHNVFKDVVSAAGGELPFSPDFLRPTDASGLRTDTDFVMYEKGVAITPAPGSDVWATISEPYFNRTWDTFCSHAHTPVKTQTDKAGVVVNGKIAVFAHPIFTTYANHSMSFHRDLLLNVLKQLLPTPLVHIAGPTSLQASICEQGDRHLVHLLHYIPERRGLNFEVVEDRMYIAPGELTVRVEANKATLVPSGEEIPLRQNGNTVTVSVPAADGKQIICLE